MNVQFKFTNFKTILQMIEQLHKNIYDYYLYHFNLLVSFTIHKLNAKKKTIQVAVLILTILLIRKYTIINIQPLYRLIYNS